MQNQAPFLDEASFRDFLRVLQEQLPVQFERDFPDPLSSKTIVVAPSLTLDPEMLAKLKGQIYYEERMLCPCSCCVCRARGLFF